ncbi:hypothetical protein BG000_003118 [Podila horticola]|nr:hypothetical protein BG000_003118 [Podila horticola]
MVDRIISFLDVNNQIFVSASTPRGTVWYIGLRQGIHVRNLYIEHPKTVLRLLATTSRCTKLATLQYDLVFARKYFRMLRSLIRKNRGLIALEFSSVIASVDLKKLPRSQFRMHPELVRFEPPCTCITGIPDDVLPLIPPLKVSTIEESMFTVS